MGVWAVVGKWPNLTAAAAAPKTAPAPQPGHATRDTLLPHGRVVAGGDGRLQRGTVLPLRNKDRTFDSTFPTDPERSRAQKPGMRRDLSWADVYMSPHQTSQSMTSTRGRPGDPVVMTILEFCM